MPTPLRVNQYYGYSAWTRSPASFPTLHVTWQIGPQLEAEFEGVAPSMQHFALRWNDQPFEALVFTTDAPPYVIRNPKRGGKDSGPFDFEVSWRDGRTRSARRAELILMLRPIGRAPSFTALGANVQLKSVFKGAANAAAATEGPLKDFYDACVARGVREDMAKLTLARKIVAIALRLWKTGELWDATKLTVQVT